MGTEEQCSNILKSITTLLEAIYNSPSGIHADVSNLSSSADFSSYSNYSKMTSDARRNLVMSFGPAFPPFYKVYKLAVSRNLTLKIKQVNDKICDLITQTTQPNPNLIKFNQDIQDLLEKSELERADAFEAAKFKCDFISTSIHKDLMLNVMSRTKCTLGNSEPLLEKKKNEESEIMETLTAEVIRDEKHLAIDEETLDIDEETLAIDDEPLVIGDDEPLPVIIDESSIRTLAEPIFQIAEPLEINMDMINELGTDYMGAVDDIDTTMDFLSEEMVAEPEPENAIQVDECPPVVSSSCAIKLAEFAVDPSLHTTNLDQVIKKSSAETWHTTFTDEVPLSQSQDHSQQGSQILLNSTNVTSNVPDVVLQSTNKVGDIDHPKSVSFDNASFELCYLKTLNAWSSINNQVQQISGFHELSGSNSLKLQLFIHMTQGSNFPGDPEEWKNVQAQFLTNNNQLLHCKLSFSKVGKITISLPSTMDQLMVLVWKRSSFALSIDRLKGIKDAFLKKYSVPLINPRRNELPFSNYGFGPTAMLGHTRHKTQEKIKKLIHPFQNNPNIQKSNLNAVRQKSDTISEQSEGYIQNQFIKLILGDSITPGKECLEYEIMVQFYISKFVNIVANGKLPDCQNFLPLLQDLLPFKEYKPTFSRNNQTTQISSSNRMNMHEQSIRNNVDELEDSDEVQIISHIRTLGNKSCNKSVLGPETCEAVPSTSTITRDQPHPPASLEATKISCMQDSAGVFQYTIHTGKDDSYKNILQNKISFLFCNGPNCGTDFENGNLETIYQHPLKHMSESTVLMGCRSCKIVFSNRNILEQQQAMLSHITFSKHWMNVYKYGDSNPKPYNNHALKHEWCHICRCKMNKNDGGQHFRSKIHLQYLKTLDSYLSYCNDKVIKPVANRLKVTATDMKNFVLFIDRFVSETDHSPELSSILKAEYAKNVVIRINSLKEKDVKILTQSVTALNNISLQTNQTTLPYTMLSSEINKKVTTCQTCGDNFHHATNLLCHMIKYHPKNYNHFLFNLRTPNKIECSNVVQSQVQSLDLSKYKYMELQIKCQSEFHNYFSFCVHSDIHTSKGGFIEKCSGCKKKSTSIYEYYTQDVCIRHAYGYVDKDMQCVEAKIADIFTEIKNTNGKDTMISKSDTSSINQRKELGNTDVIIKDGNLVMGKNKGECSSSSSTSTKISIGNQHSTNSIYPKKHQCRLCGMAFTTNSSLKRHIANCVTTWSRPDQQDDNEEEMAQDDTISFDDTDDTMAFDDTISFSDDTLTPSCDGVEPMQVEAIGMENVDNSTINYDMANVSPVQDTQDINDETGEVGSEIPSQSDNLDKKYHYLCLDCEHEQGYNCGEECQHVDHPRFPITMDIAGHFIKAGHSNFEPIKKSYSRCSMDVRNLSYSSSLGSKVRKKWKELIMSGMLVEHKYGEMRSCLKCEESFDNALAMFSHIKKFH